MYVRTLLAFALAARLPATAQTHHTAAHHSVPGDAAAIRNIFWQPNDLHQGSPVFITVELDKPATRVRGNLVNKSFRFFHEVRNMKMWHALAGIDLEATPGQYGLDVTATLSSGHIAKKSTQITVAPGDFKTGDINLPENYVNPNDAEQKQIAADDVLKKRAYGHSAPHVLWSGDFVKPVSAAPTPSFGESRILNEKKQACTPAPIIRSRKARPCSSPTPASSSSPATSSMKGI